jgi:phenylpyruvate tautomerase PptA (4-oxalocrotonate tautomerase family)
MKLEEVKMPHIDIKMFAGRDEATKKNLAEKVFETAVAELGCDPSHLSVAVHDYDPSEWNEKVGEATDESKVLVGKLYKA